MTEQSLPEESIFLQALEIEPVADRAAYLERACGDNRQLRAEVEALLHANRKSGDLLDLPDAPALAKTIDQPGAEPPFGEGPGRQIGPYKLLEQIDEGGMGTVYLAEQTHPVQRKVALKLIKPGLDNRQVIARFEAERQALALMDHPNIARVLDAGTTGAGQPYFVMELVHGVAITKYCDQRRLSPRERLELIVPVCQAIQHAHQKGIIHRDIKPSNVLIAQYDGRPVPKVIDFGVAKATGSKLTERTLFTEFGSIVGTLEYMSPEQAEQNQFDIDTRSDIYSLGVLLYELLTGTTPLDKKRLRGAAVLELLRIIKEEPPRPSTRLSTTDELPSIAANRNLEPRKLSGLVRGELDWIVMKALEKDRNRRYETANGFALDIQRYLADEPVLACPPSVGYRLTKFARRNKAAFATAGLVAVTLFVGTVVSTWQAFRATRAEGLAQTRLEAETRARTDADIARNEAEVGREREKALKEEAVQQKQRAEANFDKARRAVDEYLTQVTESELLTVPGLQPLREDLLEAALKFYTEFTQERADDPTLQRELASAHFRMGRIHQELGNADKSRKANLEAIRLYEQLRDAGHFDRDMQVALAGAYFHAARYDDSAKLCRNVLLAAPGHAVTRSLLAETCNSQAIGEKDIDAALKYHRQAFELREALVRDAPDNPHYLAQLGSTVNNLGVLLSKQKKTEEALVMYERAVEYSAQAYERAPHSILWGRWLCTGLQNCAGNQAELERKRDALASYQRLVAVSRKRAFQNPAVTSLRGELCNAHLALARYQRQLGNTAEASRSFREAREVLENIPRETAQQLYELATVYAELAQPTEGEIVPTGEDAAERQRQLDLTLQTLQKAAEAGFINVQALKTNRLFDVLRERAEFQRLIGTIDKAAQAQQLVGRKEGTAGQKLADRLKAAQLLGEVVTEQPGAVGHRSTLASTHHSIGMIQMGLKQFDDAEKSLLLAIELRDAIRLAQPGRPELEVEWIGARIALGNLYWSSERFPEAHRIWQECSPKLLEIADKGRDHAALQQRIAGLERLMGDAYAGYALWPLAREYALRNGRYRRITRHVKDAEYASLLFTVDDPQVVNDYLALLGEQLKGDEAGSPWAITHLVRVAAFSHATALTPDDLVSRSRKALAKQNGNASFRAVLAMTLYRAGEFGEAHEILRSPDVVRALGERTFANAYPFSFRQIPYLDAVVASAVGDESAAQESFARAESLYQGICLDTVACPAAELGLPQPHWNELACLQALRREAWLRVKGAAAPDDPWQHLIQARGYRLIGEIEKADQELSAAVAATPDAAAVWMARARLHALWGDQAGPAEPAWQRSVELAGSNPIPWIHRSRWHAERGEHEKANADLAQAALLTPNELNRFLEAGWWVVGPYPQELTEFCPPELDPDPSRPVHIVDPKAGLSDQPAKWHSSLTGCQGLVDLKSLPMRQDNTSIYALAYVFSPDEQTKLLMIARTQPLRVWINGTLVEDYAPGEYPIQPGYEPFHRVPVVLRAGRNSILVKSRTADFTLRIGDTPRDRALLLAEQDRFTEAFAARAAFADTDRSDASHAMIDFRGVVALLGSQEEYTQTCRALLPSQDLGIAEYCARRPNAAFAEHAETLVAGIEDLLSKGQAPWVLTYGALVHYRAGNLERSLALLDQTPWKLYGPPLHALLAQQAGDNPAARKFLQDALAFGSEQEVSLKEHHRSAFFGKNCWWYDWAGYLTWLREAEQAMRGETVESDALRARCEVIAKEKWTDAPETAAFDHALLFGSVDVYLQAKFPQPYLARGRRLAELGRFDDAGSDFNMATQLKPDDPHIAIARAAFLAECGDIGHAADAFLSALRSAKAKDQSNDGLVVEDELARRTDVLEELLRRHPQDEDLNRIRGDAMARSARWEEARRSYSSGKPSWRHEASIAALSLLLEDEAAYEQACRRQPDLLRQSGAKDMELAAVRQVETRGLRAVDSAEAAELLRLLENAPPHANRSQHWWFAMGLAQYRAGKSEEAIESLSKARGPQNDWHQDAYIRPILAMAHWRLERQDEARKWLARAETWLELTHRASDIPRSIGSQTVSDWLIAHVLHWEAKALIDGAASAAEARQLIATRAEACRQDALTRAAIRKQNRLTTDTRSARRSIADEANRHDQLGKVLYQQGKFAEAETEFLHVVRLMPGRVSGYFDLAMALGQQKKYAAAMAALGEAKRHNPPRGQVEDALGWLHLEQEQFPEAEAAFREATDSNPDLFSGHWGLARTLHLQKHYADELVPLREAVRLDPRHEWARETLGWVLRAQQLLVDAETQFLEAIRLNSDNATAHLGLGLVLSEQKKYSEAIPLLRKAIRLQPAHDDWHCHLGWALMGDRKPVEAETEFRDQLRLKPDSSDGHRGLGVALLDQNKPVEAEPELREAIRLGLADPWTQQLLKRALDEQLLARAKPAAEKRDWKTAAAELGAGFKPAPPDDTLVWCSLALAQILAEDLPGYKALVAQIPEKFRGREDMHLIRACSLRAEGAADPAELLRWTRRAYEAERNHMTACNLGVAHYRNGEFEFARQYIADALTLADWFIYYPALAMTHHRLGQADAAREWLDKAEGVFRDFTNANGERLKYFDGHPWWQDWAYFEVMLLEARSLIAGEKK